MKNKFKSTTNNLFIMGAVPFGILLTIIFIISIMIMNSSKNVDVPIKKEVIQVDTVYIECDKRHFECPEEKVKPIKPKSVIETPKIEPDTL